MSEMVERVAMALHKAHYERGRGLAPDWDKIDRFEKEMWVFSARAAIAAMREPSQGMRIDGHAALVGSKASSPDLGHQIGFGALGDAWQAMIDAALK
jgi:hypothetical protein